MQDIILETLRFWVYMEVLIIHGSHLKLRKVALFENVGALWVLFRVALCELNYQDQTSIKYKQ